MLHSEQKSIQVMKLIVSKFSKRGDSVLDTFGEFVVTAKACLALPKHRTVIGRDSTRECVEETLP